MHGADQLRMLTEQGKGAGDEEGDGLWEHKEGSSGTRGTSSGQRMARGGHTALP